MESLRIASSGCGCVPIRVPLPPMRFAIGALPSRIMCTPAAFPAAAEFDARSLLAAPLMAFNEVIGAVTFLHDSDDEFFNEDFAAKATILAGQLGTLLEAARLAEASKEEHRRAEILADVAHALHSTPDVTAVIEALADRLRLLLRTRLVCVLLRREGPFELKAVSAETPQLATSARARHDRQTLRFAADLAQRAVAAGEPITLSIGADVHSLGNLVSPGMLIAAPFRTSRTQGAILIYPRQDGVFTSEERALVAAITGFGAVAVAHAELHATAHAQAHELHQLLEISSELSSSGDLERFLQAFRDPRCRFSGIWTLLHRLAWKKISSWCGMASKEENRAASRMFSRRALPLERCVPRKCFGPTRPAAHLGPTSMWFRNIRFSSCSPYLC